MPEPTNRHEHAALLPHLLELDAVIHESVIRRAIQTLQRHTGDDTVARILDIGAGTGSGTFALAAAYPEAEVVAVDVDQDRLDGIRRRTLEQEGAARIRTVRLDIGETEVVAGTADAAWASQVMHEMPDPATAFGNVFRSLRRGGVLAVVEMDAAPSVLPPEYAGLETTFRAAVGADTPGPDWSDVLAAAGFDLRETRTLASDETLPAEGPGGAYAAIELRRLMPHALRALPEAIIADLRELVTDLSTHHELITHVRIRGTRTLWIARRP